MGQYDSGKDPGNGPNVAPLPSNILPDIYQWHPDPKPLPQETIQHGVSYLPKVKNEHASCGGPNIMVPLLKHWTALPALSYFLTNSMHIRESSQRIVAPFTFKPPPRVAMPENKQAAWLADLANPEYPLKRLGRTVPSGLKGSVLLSQCLEYRVPLLRLVWLIKCFGASEVRSLKRKFSESDPQPPYQAFIAEWTADVLDFVEQAISAYAQTSSTDRLKYAIDTLCSLFEEMLVDRTQVFDWLIQKMLHGDVLSVPVLAHLCYDIWDAFKLEPQATQLARAVALRTPSIAHSPSTLGAMDALLLRLFVTCPDAFTVPDLWPKFEPQLKRAVDLPALLTKVRKDRQLVLASIEALRERNDVFSFVREVPKEWSAAAQVEQVLTRFSVPYSVPDLVAELRQLRLTTPVLFSALLLWTLRKASSRSVHLCVAVCQQLAVHGLQLQDCLVECLMRIKPYQCNTTLYSLLAWLYRSNIFRLETYFRRLIASGILHLQGSPRDSHQHILENLPFTFMSRDLRSQALMLLRGGSSSQHDDCALEALADRVFDITAEAPRLPNDLKRDEELRLSAAIYNQYKLCINTPEKVTPLLCARVVEALDCLGDKYTTFRVVWLTLSSAVEQDLYMFAHLVSLQNLYYFICMRVSNALIQVVYSRRSDFVVSITEPSFENANIVMMLRSALKDQPDNQVNMYLRSLETIVAVSSMTPDAMVDDDANFDATTGNFLERYLESFDRHQILQLRAHHARSPLFMQQVRDWLALRPECPTEFIVWLVANSCIAFSDVYNCLIDSQDEKLFDSIFAPISEFELSAMERVHIEIIRQKFTLLAPPEEIYYLLSKITSAPRLELAISLLIGRIRYNSERFSQMLLQQLPDGREKEECLSRVVGQQLGLEPHTDHHQCLIELLDVCNVFNIGFCQIGAWLNYKDLAPDRVAALVLDLVKSGRLPPVTNSLQILFRYLDQDTRRAIQNAAEVEFMTGEIPHPYVEHLLQILGNLDPGCGEPQQQQQQHDKGLQLIECVARIVEVCTSLAQVDARIRATIQVLLKLINLECAGSSVDSNMYLPTVAAMLPSLQQLPVIAQNGDLSQMISDALRILNRQDKLTTSIPCHTSPLEGLALYSATQKTYAKLQVCPFDLIEETGGAGNDAPIDLAKFEAYLEPKDIP